MRIVQIIPFLISLFLIESCTQSSSIGVFEENSDIGNVEIPGSVIYNAENNSYKVSASGKNMWADNDEFHYVWKKISGDVSITSNIKWVGEGVNGHRKACLIIRQDLDPQSAYADIAVHGDGLTSLQYREFFGDITREIKSNIIAPEKVKIAKEGKYISISTGSKDRGLTPSGGSIRLQFKDPFYLGIGVCSHESDITETAIFSNVSIETPEKMPDSLKSIESTLETISVSSFNRTVVFHDQSHFEAPNWSPDGKTLIFNSNGLLYKIPVEGGKPQLIPTGFAKRINNDHGISTDGKKMVISDQTETGKSLIYSIPIEGGDPQKITPLGPSYWHGWSPDEKTLVYCAERNGNYDVYSIPFKGGKERRLTTAEGLDDGPDFSPDGKYIYFNSVRTGTMQVWRMKADGSDEEQITIDDLHDWFPHPSPDGKWIVYLTFGTDVPANSHPPNKDIMLRLMNLDTKEVSTIAKIFGGQGTINVPSWSPDSQHLAFVSYGLH